MQPIRREDDIRIKLVNKDETDRLGHSALDDLYFDQVVQNILHNAVKYSYPYTIVMVTAGRDGTRTDT